MSEKLEYLTPEQVNQVRDTAHVSQRVYILLILVLQVPSRWVSQPSSTICSVHKTVYGIYHRYLRLPSFLEPDEVEALLTRTRQLLDNFSIEDHPLVRLAHL